MANVLFFILTLVAGGALAIQAGTNSQLRMSVGDPIISSVFSFSVGLTGLLIFVSLQKNNSFPSLDSLSQITWWKWIGGLLGAFYIVVTVLVAPKIGAVSFISLTIAGQLVTSLFLDHFGLVGFNIKPVTLTKIVGVICLFLGVYLITKK
ncbi:MAG: DMT family transporter [Thermoflexibacter sp.]